MPLQYRAEFDAVVTFSNGGGLRTHGFRVDVAHADATEAEISALFVSACRLLMVSTVELSNVRVFAEPHLGTPGGPSEPPARRRWAELSHVISEGLVTYPGLPAPAFTPHLTREASRGVYAEGTEFAMDLITMIGNTGTYLDSPFHRYADGTDLAGLPLERLADLPAVVVRSAGRGVTAEALEHLEVAGRAVLLNTGGDRHWGTPQYAVDAPFLTGEGAQLLADRGAALVGIDSINIDDTSPAAAGTRPAHTVLLAAGIPIVEHLTGLGDLPPTGARFTAAPPRVAAFGTFPVRAYASLPVEEPHDHHRSAGWLPTS
ncbi:cyclase family protein [Actinoplanes sp. NPDC051494]|uniref:cyclase family protein n=1 Tax=Actinoplanes sp. NPDC051494 TaxID=3363907 RepID=UPI0037903A67